MSFEYLPVMAANAASKPPRQLVLPAMRSWCPVRKPVGSARVALLTSAALRLQQQQPFIPREDLSYRVVPSDPSAGDLIIDHHSGIGRVPKQDPEIVFPRTALATLVQNGVVGALAPNHISIMGGLRRHKEVETELAPAVARELAQAQVDLALLVPY
jgi:D-proline reductase (dithiol) PrdB